MSVIRIRISPQCLEALEELQTLMQRRLGKSVTASSAIYQAVVEKIARERPQSKHTLVCESGDYGGKCNCGAEGARS